MYSNYGYAVSMVCLCFISDKRIFTFKCNEIVWI